MKITRKIADSSVKFGETPITQTTMTITLTDAELQEAYDEYMKHRYVRDTKYFLNENYDGEFDDETIEAIARDYKAGIAGQVERLETEVFDDVMTMNYPEYERNW